MPGLRRLSGDAVIAILARLDFRIHSQRGSHVKLRRNVAGGTVQTLTVPRHRELGVGTLLAIFRQASRFIPEEQLREEFFTD